MYGSLAQQTLEVVDFSGGVTDFYVDAPPKYGQRVENFLITRNRKLKTRPGCTVNNTAQAKLTNRVTSLFNFKDIFWRLEQAELKYDDGNNITELAGPTSNNAFNYADSGSYSLYSPWKDFVFLLEAGHSNATYSKVIHIYKNSSSVLKLETSGLPEVGTVTASGGNVNAGGANSYVYAFVHRRTFSVEGGLTYEVVSAPSFLAVKTTNPIAADPNHVNLAVPNLTNASDENYDTTNIKVDVYRTINGGQTYYKANVADVSLNSTFKDEVTDATLVTREILYTDGGVLDNDAPPRCKFFHATTNYGYYGDIQEASQNLTSTIRQSKENALWHVPADNNIEIDDTLGGIHSFRDIPIIFGLKNVYRIEGRYDDLGRGNPLAVKISSATGCVAPASIVRTPEGLFFAGTDGFYFTDGFQVVNISRNLSLSYGGWISTATKKKRIVGAYNDLEEIVYWTIQSDSGGSENDKILAYHVWLGIKPDGAFTTWSGRIFTADSNFRPTALYVKDGNLYRHESTGYLLKHSVLTYTDPLVDTATSPTTWATTAILYYYDTPALSLGTASVEKSVTGISITAQNDSNTTLQISSLNDNAANASLIRNLSEVYLKVMSSWGTPTVTWSTPLENAVPPGISEAYRHFPGEYLKCLYKQARFTNSNSVILANRKLEFLVDALVTISEGPGITRIITSAQGDVFDTVQLAGGVMTQPGVISENVTTEFPISLIDSESVLRVDDPTDILTLGQAYVRLYRTVTSQGLATVAGTTTKTATISGTWPTDIVNYTISFDDDLFVREYTVTARTSATVLEFSDPLQTLTAGSSKRWRLKGYFKGDALHLLSYSLYYNMMANTLDPYKKLGGVGDT
jgi:hypothetical protein